MDDSEFIREYEIKDHKFMTMNEEKRARVICAALMEFSKGYAEANTDLIVKEAGISKGLLFHYFGSKRGLFLFLLKYTLGTLVTEIERVVSESNDFLENIRTASKVEGDLTIQYPLEFGFLAKAQSAIKEVFPEGLPGASPNSPHMLMQLICQRSNNDPSLFKEGIDSKKAQNIIIWTINGFSESLLHYGDNIETYKAHADEIAEEEEAYLRLLRQLLYR